MIEYHANENDTFGVFVFAGYQPNTSLVKDIVELNESEMCIRDRSLPMVRAIAALVEPFSIPFSMMILS